MTEQVHPKSALGGIAKILADLEALNAEVEATLITPPDITDNEGRVWAWWKGDLYRHEGKAWPKAFIPIH